MFRLPPADRWVRLCAGGLRRDWPRAHERFGRPPHRNPIDAARWHPGGWLRGVAGIFGAEETRRAAAAVLPETARVCARAQRSVDRQTAADVDAPGFGRTRLPV